MTTLLVDNFDSFTHNLDQAIRSLGIATSVVRVDSPSLKGIVERRTFSTLVISPGPKHPQDAAVSVELIRRFFGLVPILGVCLGQQCLAEEITALGLSVLPALGASPDGLWREPSWFVPGLDRARTLALARRHHQHAAFFIRGGRTGLLLTLSGRWLIRPSLAAHPSFTDLPRHGV